MKNDGNVTYHNVKVDDELTGMHEVIPTLKVGEEKTFTTEWTVTEEDILKGKVLNSVIGEGDRIDPPAEDPDEPGEDPTNPGKDPDDPGKNPDEPGKDPDEPGKDPDEPGKDPDEPGKDPDEPGKDPYVPYGHAEVEDDTADIKTTLTVVKQSDVPEGEAVSLGTIVNYTITVTNDGNVTAYNVQVEDELEGLTIVQDDMYTVNGNTATIAQLRRGETVIIMATYEVQPEDQTNGVVHNVATATGDPIINPNYDPDDPDNPDNPKEYVPEGQGETDVEVKPEVHTIQVEYVYEDGTPVKDPTIINKEYGKNYEIVSPKIPGFTPDIPTVEGIVGHDDVHVVVTYYADTYTLTIKYVDEKGNALTETYQAQLKFGEAYNVKTPNVPHYKPVQKHENQWITGTMPAQDTVITVVYTPINQNYTTFDDPITPLGITVNLNIGECYE